MIKKRYVPMLIFCFVTKPFYSASCFFKFHFQTIRQVQLALLTDVNILKKYIKYWLMVTAKSVGVFLLLRKISKYLDEVL